MPLSSCLALLDYIFLMSACASNQPLTVHGIYEPRQLRAYFRSFSIRSTCVIIMRRQQYRLHSSLSIASLQGERQTMQYQFSINPLTLPLCLGRDIRDIVPTGRLRPVFGVSKESTRNWVNRHDGFTLPHEKQRTGIIMAELCNALAIVKSWAVGRLLLSSEM